MSTNTTGLFEAVKSMKLTRFAFTHAIKHLTDAKRNEKGDVTEPSSFRLELFLQTPLEQVVGSQKLYDGAGKPHPFIVHDVESVFIHANLIEEHQEDFIEWEVNGTSVSGVYEGNLFFDVAKSSLDVMLTDVKLSSLSYDWKQKARAEKNNRLIGLMAKTK